MANLIILEGLSRTGKSTISKFLSEKYGFRNISLKEKMPHYVKNLPDFYHGMHTLFNEIYREFPNETFILDRSFISELVYSKFFNRPTYQNQSSVISDLLFDNNFVLIYLSNNYSSYIERKPKDRMIYTEKDFIEQKDLFDWFFNYYRSHNDSSSWKTRFLELHTAYQSLDECISEIEKTLTNNKITTSINV